MDRGKGGIEYLWIACPKLSSLQKQEEWKATCILQNSCGEQRQCPENQLLITHPRTHFFSVALRPRKRGGLLGTGWGEGGTKEWRLDLEYRPKETGESVDRRQNNGSIKAVSPRHCQRLVHCATAVSTAVFGQSQCQLHCCWRTTRSERSQLSQTSSTSLLIISSGLTSRSSSTSLL